MNTGKIILGVMAGIAAGAILGALLAPDKGSKTRQQINDLGESYADAIKEKFDRLVDSFAEHIKNDKKTVEKITAKVKSITDDAKKIVNETV